MAAPNSDSMIRTANKHGTSSTMDRLVLDAENRALKQEVDRLRRETRELKSQEILRQAESASDFTAGQMDRVVYNVRNVNYGMDKLVSSIDSIRRYDSLRQKKEGLLINPNGEAVSVVYLSMDHYKRQKDICSETRALSDLRMLAGKINQYFEMRCRPADCFAKGGWQDHMFMFVLPATDRKGAKTFLNRVMKTALAGYEQDVSISYGVANFAADVKETHSKETSRAIALRLVDSARKTARDRTSGFSGSIENQA